jgi:hypothetical protein
MTFASLSQGLGRDTAPVPFPGFIYRDYFPAVNRTCTSDDASHVGTFGAIAPASNKVCTMTAKTPARLTPFSRAGLHGDYSSLKYHDPYINSVDNTPSRQAGSFPGLRRLAEGDAKTAHRAVSIRSAIFIAGTL